MPAPSPLTRCRRTGGGGAARVRRRRRQRRGDQCPRLGRVDDVVDLEHLSGVERLGILLRGGGGLPDPLLALIVVGDRLEFLAQAQPDGALEAHRPEMRTRPCHRQHRLVQAAARHRLRTEAVAAAQHDRDERHPQRGAGNQQPGGAAHQGLRLRIGPDHVARAVDERHDGRPNASHSCRKRAALSAAAAVIAPAITMRVVGDDADRAPFDPRERGDHLGRETPAQERHRTLVGQRRR